MSKKKNKQQGGEILENPEVLAEQISITEEFFKSNKTIVYVITTVIAVIVAVLFGYKYYATNQDDIAQIDMFQAVFYFESDSLDKALNGDGNNYGFLEIIDEYSVTKSANLAHFYAGSIYLKQGDYNSAIEYLRKFKSSDLLVQPRSLALIGDAYMELEDFGEASKAYKKAANNNPNKEFSPHYLVKAAVAYENDNNLKSALECYEIIVDKYFDGDQTVLQNAKKHKARLSGLTSNK
jgi:tetratricopeptide (TPR) repeat protein